MLITTPRGPYSDYIHDRISTRDYGVDVCYSLVGGYKNKLLRAIRNFWIRFLPFKFLLFEKWKREINSYNVVIIIRDQYGEIIADYVSKHSSCKTVLFFMDPYEKSHFIKKIPLNPPYIVSSFEKATCEKYGFKYNSLFFFKEELNTNVVRDVFFVGTDKGRLESLKTLENVFNMFGLKCYFHICKSPGRDYNDDQSYHYEEPIPYHVVLEKERESAALLDILPEGQKDLTLRCYESYFLKKKLITNNMSVLKYDFYNKNNVFVIGLDDLNEINTFLKKPYEAVFDKEMEQSSFDNWIKRYLE